MKVYNTLTRKKEDFVPVKSKEVGMYCCGLTVSNYAHIGNLRTYIFEDVLKRVLLYNGYKVKHVMNITDVGHLTSDADTGDDKVEEGAKREHKDAFEISEFYTKTFMEDLKRLNILMPDVMPKATETVFDQISMIKRIEENGFAYRTDDGVYFDTSKLKDYGKLARLNKEKLKAGARVEMRGKRNPTDFALWKLSPEGKKRQMEWDSPWGIGFPGWHIECSTMSMKHLGEVFDIHCGGIDHIPVHHTNEIAQSQAVTGKDPVRYWMHGEFLVMGKEKMAKSLGNFITLWNLIENGIDPLAYRYFCLGAHYRSQLAFDPNAIKSAQVGLERMRDFMGRLKEAEGERGEDIGQLLTDTESRFRALVSDDLDMPKAVAVVSDFVRRINSLMDSGRLGKEDAHLAYGLMLDFDSVLGLRLEREDEDIPDEVRELAKEREEQRKMKNFKEADGLRYRLKEMGWEVLDTPKGPKIKKIGST